MGQSEELKKEAQKALEEYTQRGPFTSDKSPAEALAVVAEMRTMLNMLKEQEMAIRKGLGMFKIDQPLSKELQMLEKVGVQADRDASGLTCAGMHVDFGLFLAFGYFVWEFSACLNIYCMFPLLYFCATEIVSGMSPCSTESAKYCKVFS